MVYVIQVCWQVGRKLSSNLYVLLCVQWKYPDDGQRNCPKHVEFYCKNKFEKLVLLVGFIIRIYRDARSPERQLYEIVRIHVLSSLYWISCCPHADRILTTPHFITAIFGRNLKKLGLLQLSCMSLGPPCYISSMSNDARTKADTALLS